ncbi:hypothetical protein EPN52_07515 [bacterium]|nr:MAG: hypothetical protein EPN52_07515 [bacterium]
MQTSNVPSQSVLYDWAIAIASLWLGAGIFVDTWHHFHHDVETFFEPAHGLLYAGLLAAYVCTAVVLVHYHRRGYPWRQALPAGYGVTLAGLVIGLAGGLADLIKHSLWGFEEGFNALLSPTHLLIGAGMFLICAGPIRAAQIHRPRTLAAQLPLLIAAASLLELLHWGTQFIFVSEAARMNAPLIPASSPRDALTLLTLAYYKQGIGLLAVLVQSLLLAGFALYLKHRFDLRPGALTLFMLLGNVFVAGAHSNDAGQFAAVVAASLACGIVGDALRAGYVFAFAVPAVYWSVYLAVLAATMGGIWWTPDVTAGSILFAGLVGAFLNALCNAQPRAVR